MLRRPDWKRTRQACGFCGAANPLLSPEKCRGGDDDDTHAGEGMSLLRGPGAASLGLSSGRATPGHTGRW